jgi:hypothetical protein
MNIVLVEMINLPTPGEFRRPFESIRPPSRAVRAEPALPQAGSLERFVLQMHSNHH